MTTALIISPHLDDAALSCGELILRLVGDYESVVVVTVFAGLPEDPAFLSDHDRFCGFASSAEAISCRRDEDAAAADLLGCTPIWLGLPELAYVSERTKVVAVSEVIEEHVDAADVVYAPLGLQHPDHIVTADAAWLTCREKVTQLVLYEEIPYRVETPIETMRRIRQLGLTEHAACDVPPRGNVEKKRGAVRQYASQMGTLDLDCCFVRERLWRLHDWPDVPFS